MNKEKPFRASCCDSLNKLLKILRITFILLYLGCLQVYAFEKDPKPPEQQTVVTGTITDSQDGSLLPGVNIQIKGTTRGVISDIGGKFSLSVPSLNETLIFSFVGYITQEVALGTKYT